MDFMNIFKKKETSQNIIASVVFTETNGKIFYEFKNSKGENLKYDEVNPHFLFPLIRSIERLFWVDPDEYTGLTEDDFRNWYLKGLKNTYAKDPKAFYDAYTELLAEKAPVKDLRGYE